MGRGGLILFSLCWAFAAGCPSFTGPPLATSGIISEPNPYTGTGGYSPGTDCTWVLQANITNPSLTMIAIVMTAMNTEGCCDHVIIRDGPSITSPVIGDFSGGLPLAMVQTTQPFAFIRFTSDGSIQGSGWQLTWDTNVPAQCSAETNSSAATGLIKVPSLLGVGWRYFPNAYCVWNLRAAATYSFVRFVLNGNFSTEPGVDFVRVYDGTSVAAPLLLEASGFTPRFVSAGSSGSALTVVFSSNPSVQYAGFSASWASFNAGAQCNGFVDTAANTSGVIQSPLPYNGYNRYADNLACSWLIRANSFSKLQLVFTDLITEPGDILAVYDGNSTDSPMIFSTSGVTIPSPVISSGRYLFITFASDAATTWFNQSYGFRATWSASNSFPSYCNGTEMMPEVDTGIIQTPQPWTGQYYYASNRVCVWTVYAEFAERVALGFFNFDIAVGDVLQLRDGPLTNSPLLFSGNTQPGQLLSTQQYVTVLLIANGDLVTGTGFNLQWNATNVTAQCVPFTDPIEGLDHGIIQEPIPFDQVTSYPNGQTCVWTIRSLGAGTVARYNITDYAIEYYGNVQIFDGNSTNAQRIGFLTGYGPFPNLVWAGSTEYLTIYFYGSGGGHGFRGYWDSPVAPVCAVGVANVDASTAGSLGYPNGDGVFRSGNNETCTWLFTSQSGYLPRVAFSWINTEAYRDNITLFDGPSTSSPILLMLSGTTAPKPIAASSRYLTIQYSTSLDVTSLGFLLTYSQIIIPVQCSAGPVMQSGGDDISVPDAYDVSTRYANSLNCQWLLTASSPSLVVQIEFSIFDTEPGVDILTLYDGSDATADALVRLSGQTPSPRISSSGQHMFIVFSTNAINKYSGFVANWSSVVHPATCSGVVAAPTQTTGDIANPNPWGNNFFYVNGASCQWAVRAVGGFDRILFTLLQVSTEPINDALTIYEGTTVNSNQIIYQGSGYAPLPSAGYSIGRDALVVFTSNAANVSTGFQLHWQATNDVGQCLQQQVYTNANSGYISAPLTFSPSVNYVPGRSRCTWVFHAPSGTNTIRFSFSRSSTYSDGLRLYEGEGDTRTYLTYIGSDANTPVRVIAPLSPTVTVEYNAMYDGYWGFEANWTAVNVGHCSGLTQLSGASGTFANPDPADGLYRYKNDESCQWQITAPSDTYQVRLYINYLVTAESADHIDVYDGTTTASTLLYTNYGSIVAPYTTTYPVGIPSTGQYMLVVWTTNSVNQINGGFSASYTTGPKPSRCADGSTVSSSAATGVMQEPTPWDGANSPVTPTNGQRTCQYIITAPTGYTQILVYILQLNIYAYDHIYIYDGPSTTAPKIHRLDDMSQTSWTYQPPPQYVASLSSTMTISYEISPSAPHGYGFLLNWTAVVGPPQCEAFNFPYNQSGGSLLYPSAYGSGYRYQPGLDCLWVLRGTSRIVAYFDFVSLIGADTLTVYDGYHTGAPKLWTFNAANSPSYPFAPSAPYRFVSGTEWMVVRLQSSLTSATAYGFSAQYDSTSTLGGSAPQDAQVPFYDCDYSGYISVPSSGYDGTTTYAYKQNAHWVIHANPGTYNINITILNYTTGDALYIRDPALPSNPIIWQGSGNIQGPIYVPPSAGPTLTLDFNTGSAGTGFLLYWYAFNDTGVPRTVGCAPVPYPCPPAVSTTGADAQVDQPSAFAAFASSTTGVVVLTVSAIAAIALIAVPIVIIVLIRRRREKEAFGDSTVRMDTSPEAIMKKRITGLLKASTTKQIGKGGTAIVYRVQMEDGTLVAMKKLTDQSDHAKAEFHREVTIFSRLTGQAHPNVLQLVLYCNDPPVIVCELAESGSLLRMRKQFAEMPQKDRKDLLLQIAEGMQFLHSYDIVHLDLKPENVLVGDKNSLKISDFGTSLILGQDIQLNDDGLAVLPGFTGTPQYSSPERFIHGKRIDLKRADVFSYGVIAWSVATGESPFSEETADSIMSIHTAGSFDMDRHMPIPESGDEMILEVIRRSLMTDFALRPLFPELCDILRAEDLKSVPTMNYSAKGKYGSMTGSTVGSFNSALNTQADSLTIFDTVAPPPPKINTASTRFGDTSRSRAESNFGTNDFDSVGSVTIAPPPPSAKKPPAKPPMPTRERAATDGLPLPPPLVVEDGRPRGQSSAAGPVPNKPLPSMPPPSPSTKSNPFAKK